MAFASIFIPNFMLQAVVRSEPTLRDRAVAIIAGAVPVWSVVACNETAAKAGIALGMTKSQAQQFCGVEIRHRSPAREKAAHAALLDLGWSLSPRVEDTAPDTMVLDLAGLNSLLGSDEKIANQLVQRASSLGLSAQIAVASKIEAAIIAARGFSGIAVIPQDAEPEILGQLPVSALSPSSETLETLDRWGVRTCGALAALPVLQLSERLGQEGVRLHGLAAGKSGRAMVLAGPAADFEEEMELEDAVEELEPLSFLLGRLLGQLCARLQARSLAASAIRVRFELDPSCAADLTQPSRKSEPQRARRKTGEAQGAKCYDRVLSLALPICNPKTLLNLLRLHLRADPPTAPVVKIVLAADAASPRVAQAGIFRPSSPDPEKLELTIARIANVVGDANVGSPELVDTHRPEEFRMRSFVSDVAAPNRRRESDAKARSTIAVPRLETIPAAQPGGEIKPLVLRNDRLREVARQRTPAGSKENSVRLTGFRVFRPRVTAKVDLRDGCPAKVRFQGLDGHVVAASGPWRSSGDWWREDGWQNDEWDLEIVFSFPIESRVPPALGSTSPARVAASCTKEVQRGFYRIFFDAIRKEWFVRGAYD